MDFDDRRLECSTCGADFVWTAGEQRFFAERSLEHAPRHCPACRRHQGPGRQPDARRARVTVEVECSNCGRKTTVPFRPASGRPVYCRSCYEQRRHRGAGRTPTV